MAEYSSESIIAVLRHDHTTVSRDLDALLDPQSKADHRELLDQLTADLVRHFVGEEQYLLPALRYRFPDGERMADSTLDEHRAIEGELRRLQDKDLDPAGVGAALTAVRTAFTAHVEQQERAVLPPL